MNDLDERIQKALEVEDKALLDKYKEPKLIVQIGRSFRGEVGIIMSILILSGIAATAIAGVSVYYYFNSADQEVRDLCAIGFLTGMIWAAFTKLFFYQQLGQLNVLREIKRLELQVSLLVEKKA